MPNKQRPNVIPDKKFRAAIEVLSNTPPISNKDIIKRSKNKKKK